MLSNGGHVIAKCFLFRGAPLCFCKEFLILQTWVTQEITFHSSNQRLWDFGKKTGRAGPAVWERERKVEWYLSALFWSGCGTRSAASRPAHKRVMRGKGSSSCSSLRGSPNSHHLQLTAFPQALPQHVAHPHLLSHGRNIEATDVNPQLPAPAYKNLSKSAVPPFLLLSRVQPS